MICNSRDPRSQRAFAAFAAKVAACGAEVLEPEWLGNKDTSPFAMFARPYLQSYS